MHTPLHHFKAEFFRALAHPTRIRVLEVLGRGEHTVKDLQEALDLGQSVVSQQLAVLRNRNIVTARKEGATVHYALSDPHIKQLLKVARDIFDNHLVGTRAMLNELRRERRR